MHRKTRSTPHICPSTTSLRASPSDDLPGTEYLECELSSWESLSIFTASDSSRSTYEGGAHTPEHHENTIKSRTRAFTKLPLWSRIGRTVRRRGGGNGSGCLYPSQSNSESTLTSFPPSTPSFSQKIQRTFRISPRYLRPSSRPSNADKVRRAEMYEADFALLQLRHAYIIGSSGS